jgi:hypothetical protein
LKPTSLKSALNYCLENPDGLSVRELLDLFPEHREELAALLGLTAVIQASPPPVRPERRAAMKARIVEAAAQLRPQYESTDPAPDPEPEPTVPPLPFIAAAAHTAPPVAASAVTPDHVAAAATSPMPRISGPVPIGAYTKKRAPLFLRPGFLTAVAAALILAFVWWSSRDALPDSPFYNVRIASENIAINFAGSDENQARAHLNLAASRLYELREMQQRSRLLQAQEAVVNYEHHLSSAELLWQRMSPPALQTAELLYATSLAGQATFDALDGALNSLPAPYMNDVTQALDAVGRVTGETERALVAAGRDPAAVLTSLATEDTTLAGLISSAVPTLPVPAEPTEPPTSTGTTPSGDTPTSVAVVVDTPTTEPTGAPTTPPTEPPAPTDTPLPPPPSETPTMPPPPPSATPRPAPSATRTPRPVVPTRTAQPQPVATDTPVIVAATACDLSISNVSVACREEGGVNWLGLVTNRGDTPVTASWTAVLEVQNQGGGGFTQVMSMSGTDVFVPGTTNLNRTMQYAFGPDATKARVILRIDTAGYACTVPAKQSLDVASCNRQNENNGNGGKPEKTMTPPGLENKPTERPKEDPPGPNDGGGNDNGNGSNSGQGGKP